MPVFAAGCCIWSADWRWQDEPSARWFCMKNEAREECTGVLPGWVLLVGFCWTCNCKAACGRRLRHNKFCFPLRRVRRDWPFCSCTCLGLERQCSLPLYILFSCLLVMLLLFQPHPHCVCRPRPKRVCNNPFALLQKSMQDASNIGRYIAKPCSLGDGPAHKAGAEWTSPLPNAREPAPASRLPGDWVVQ